MSARRAAINDISAAFRTDCNTVIERTTFVTTFSDESGPEHVVDDRIDHIHMGVVIYDTPSGATIDGHTFDVVWIGPDSGMMPV